MSYTVIRYLRRCRPWQIYDSEFDCVLCETREEARAAEGAAWKKGADEVKVFAGDEVDLLDVPEEDDDG